MGGDTVLTLTLCWLWVSVGSAEPVGDKWGRLPPPSSPQVPTMFLHIVRTREDQTSDSEPLTFQNVQGVLHSIEQRLRGLDSIRHTVSRTEISVDTLGSRIELMETRLTGIQNTIQHKFDALAAAVAGAEMKYELQVDQLTRKLQAELDRIQHKLTSAEARVDASILKLQNQMEISFQKVESKQNNIGNEFVKVHNAIDVIKFQSQASDQRINRTLGLVVNQLQDIHGEQSLQGMILKNVSNSVVTALASSGNHNRSMDLRWQQSDAPLQTNHHPLQLVRAEIAGEANKIGAKMNNMYNDMWRNIKDLEVIFKLALNENNNKTRELHDELSKILIEEQRDTEGFLDVMLQSLMSGIQTKLGELSRRIETNAQTILASQDMHIDCCDKVRSLIEGKVAVILERVYDSFTNRTEKLSKQVTDASELLKAEGKLLGSVLTKTNQNIITLASESSQHHKQLDSGIVEAAEKADDLSMTLQEIQMQTQEINDAFLKQQKSLKEIKGLLVTRACGGINVSTDISQAIIEPSLHALEANFSDGIIKILTSGNRREDDGGKQIPGVSVPLTRLNQSVSTADLVAVIGEPDDDDFDAQEEYNGTEENSTSIDPSQLMLAYIKYLRGHLTVKEFLSEAVPGTRFDSVQEMARALRKAGTVPREMIANVEDMANSQDNHRSGFDIIDEDPSYDEPEPNLAK